MSSSTTPAKNENVPYGALLAQSGKLKRSDQVLLVKALAGQLGMIAMFPGQIPTGSASAGPAKAGKAEKKKAPAKQEPTNPLSGTAEKKDFDAAKKAVSKATKEAGNKLPDSHELVLALENAKDKYFRALSNAKSNETQVPKGPETRISPEERREVERLAERDAQAGRISAKPDPSCIKEDAKGKLIWYSRDEAKWHFVSEVQRKSWGL